VALAFSRWHGREVIPGTVSVSVCSIIQLLQRTAIDLPSIHADDTFVPTRDCCKINDSVILQMFTPRLTLFVVIFFLPFACSFLSQPDLYAPLQFLRSVVTTTVNPALCVPPSNLPESDHIKRDHKDTDNLLSSFFDVAVHHCFLIILFVSRLYTFSSHSPVFFLSFYYPRFYPVSLVII
jgi:hypothetical protein